MEQPAPLSEVAPDVPLELQQIVSQLLEKDSEKRIPTATVLLRRLEAMEHAISLASPVAPVSPAPAPIELAETKATAAFVNSPEPTISEPGKTAGRFTLVGKDELDPADSGQSSSSLVQTGVLIASLIAIAATIWYLLQPPTADALFDRIEARTANGDPESLLHAEDDIRSFLSRFHKDSRCERMKEYEHQIELYRLQQKFERRAKGHGGVESLLPVERAYVDALNYSRLDPDRGMLKFQALIDLYKERPGLAGPAGECLELAQRQLARLREQIEATAAEHLGQLQDRLDRADQIRKSDPARAEAMYRAAIVLYGDKQWAAQAVRRAKEALNDKEKPNH
jgi:serine/threonine-protein kinase